ncbi:hypothetical protein MTO96_014177 [Rhipicephalus appendiculatus]
MANVAIALALLSVYQLGSAANDSPKVITAPCVHTPDIDWSESINSYLRNIPDTVRVGYLDDSWSSAFSLENPQLSRFGGLWLYKPPYVFCAVNDTIVEAVVLGHEPLQISVDWKSCAGSSGTFGSAVTASQLRLYFSVMRNSDGSPRLVLRNIKTDNLEDPKLFVTGTGRGMRALVEAIGVVAMPHLQLAWESFLRDDVPGPDRRNGETS